jgi:DNA-directed RNA polymerase subunit K/omega
MSSKFKATEAERTTVTRNVTELTTHTNSIYESIAVIAKRANQIAGELKEELNGKLEEFATSQDNLEEIFENREQIEISKYYEKLPKPHSVALQEFKEGNVYFRRPGEDEAVVMTAE